MGILASLRQKGMLSTILRIAWATGLILVIGMVAHHLDAQPLSVLMGYAFGVLLAAMLFEAPIAIVAITVAVIMGAWIVSPSGSFYIPSSFRVGYGFFLGLCLMISLYLSQRTRLPAIHIHTDKKTDKRADKKTEDKKANAEPYTEASLPTVANPEEELVIQQKRVIEGIDIYQWERSCAHLSDLLWDIQIQLRVNDTKQAYNIARHAYEVAAQTRQQIRDVDLVSLLDANRMQKSKQEANSYNEQGRNEVEWEYLELLDQHDHPQT